MVQLDKEANESLKAAAAAVFPRCRFRETGKVVSVDQSGIRYPVVVRFEKVGTGRGGAISTGASCLSAIALLEAELVLRLRSGEQNSARAPR